MNPDYLNEGTRFSEAIRDPVWKHIWLTPEFRDITLTQPFLRLYRIKQLGPIEFVYPGATHSRASHSLGVYYVALRLLRVLLAHGADSWVTEEGCNSFLAAALLHDLGHYPFTHSLKELPLVDHETLTARIIVSEPLRTVLGKAGANPEMTAAIVDKERIPDSRCNDETRFFSMILSGVLDPDKLDYLNRDAYYCGVPYGIQDTDFILSRVMPDRQRGIILDSHSLMSVESVLFSKYLMYRSVYWHRQVRIATAMMKKTLYTALERNLIDPEVLYSLDDDGIYALIEGLNFPEKELAAAIRNREFYHLAAEFPFSFENPGMLALETLSYRQQAEACIAEYLSGLLGTAVKPYHVLIDIPERISFESDLFISDENTKFSQSSTVFTNDIVSHFTSSLRIIRIAIHPYFSSRIDAVPDIAEKLAKCCSVRYNFTSNL